MPFSFESKQAFDSHHEKMLQKHEQKIMNMVNNLINHEEFEEIGKGNYGEVFSVGNNNNTCLKFMSPDTVYPGLVQNSLNIEAKFQEKISKINMKGVRVPRPYWVAKMTSEEGKFLQVFAMEQMNAISVNELFTEGAKLPENFDVDDFIKKLTDFIKEMHNNNYYHRDLHFGNVMIDLETGGPIVIDFGKSTEAFSSENPYKINIRPGEESTLQKDETSIKDLNTNLRSYLTNLKK